MGAIMSGFLDDVVVGLFEKSTEKEQEKIKNKIIERAKMMGIGEAMFYEYLVFTRKDEELYSHEQVVDIYNYVGSVVIPLLPKNYNPNALRSKSYKREKLQNYNSSSIFSEEEFEEVRKKLEAPKS